jgi:hypothetical protein
MDMQRYLADHFGLMERDSKLPGKSGMQIQVVVMKEVNVPNRRRA